MSRLTAVQVVRGLESRDLDRSLFNALTILATQIDKLYLTRLLFNDRKRTLEVAESPLGITIFLDNVIIGPGIRNTILNEVGKRYLTIVGVDKNGVLELATNKAEAIDNILGQIQFVDKNCATKLGTLVESRLSGISAGNRGTTLSFYTKIDNDSVLTKRVEIDEAGGVWLAQKGALGVGAIEGFTNIPTIAGKPTGTPNLRTGQIPIVADSDHDRLYGYSNGSWIDYGMRTVRGGSNFTTSSATLVDVTNLKFPLKASKDYYFEFHVMYSSASLTNGIWLSLGGPVALTSILFDAEIAVSLTAFGKAVSRVADGLSPTSSVDTINSPLPATIRGIIRNGINAGDLQLKVASENAGTDVTVLEGSMGWIKEI